MHRDSPSESFDPMIAASAIYATGIDSLANLGLFVTHDSSVALSLDSVSNRLTCCFKVTVRACPCASVCFPEFRLSNVKDPAKSRFARSVCLMTQRSWLSDRTNDDDRFHEAWNFDAGPWSGTTLLLLLLLLLLLQLYHCTNCEVEQATKELQPRQPHQAVEA